VYLRVCIWNILSGYDLYRVELERVLDYIDDDLFGMFVEDVWNPLALRIRREYAESFEQSLLTLGEEIDEIVPEQDSDPRATANNAEEADGA
jgi:hypothetical protein